MAVLEAKQLLDELMGRHRDTINEKINKKPVDNFLHPKYCKYHLVKFCPYDLFVNTRDDFGVCSKVHDDEVKKLFEKAASSYIKAQYVDKFLGICKFIIKDVERRKGRIRKGNKKLECMNLKPEGPQMTQTQTEKNQEQVKLLSEKISSLMQEAEEAETSGDVEQAQGLIKLCDRLKEEKDALLNEEENRLQNQVNLSRQISSLMQEAEEAETRGDVEQAQGLIKLCDRLKEEKDTLLKEEENSHWLTTAKLAAAQKTEMEVCLVCGGMLVVGDTQNHIDEHLSGKLHVGYFKIRQAYEEMSEAPEKEKEQQKKDKEQQKKDKEQQKKERMRWEKDRKRKRRSRSGSTGGGLGSNRYDMLLIARDRERQRQRGDRHR